MLNLILDTTTRRWQDTYGDIFPADQPQIPLGNTERVAISLYSYIPEDDLIDASWVPDPQFNLPGVTALLSIDNNFKHRLKGETTEAYSVGDITSISVKFSTITPGMIPQNGAVRLYLPDDTYEEIEYTSRSITDNIVSFQCADGSTVNNAYALASKADCSEALYAQAPMNAELSEPSRGKFVFDITVDSLKLREKVDYSNSELVDDVAGLELLIFTVEEDSITIRNSYICDTFSIPIPIGDANPNPQMPDTYKDNVAAMIAGLMSAGFDTEQRTKNDIIEIRLKLASLGDDSWSGWFAVGYQLKAQYSADSTTWSDAVVVNTKYIRTSIDGGKTWSAALLIKGADGTDGEDGNPGDAAGFGEVTSSAKTVAYGTAPSVTITPSGEDTAKNFDFVFKIPEGKQGEKGDAGQSFVPNATGATEDKTTYDAEAKGFAFLDTTEGLIYFKQSDTSGDWSVGMPFGKGETGSAAGFGTPNATVTTLEPGNNATVSVTATGEDTAKVFTFAFGIPKGAKGDLPQKGVDYFTEEDKAELVASLEDVLLSGEWGTEAEATEAEL